MLTTSLICPQNCTGNGVCVDATCQCAPAFEGIACERPRSPVNVEIVAMLVGLPFAALVAAGVIYAWCARARSSKDVRGWQLAEAKGQVTGARFERYFGDTSKVPGGDAERV